MKKYQSKPGLTGSLSLDLLSVIAGRAIATVSDTLVATIDGMKAARDSLYYSRHQQREFPLSRATISGISTIFKSNCRYYRDSQDLMYRELSEILGL